MKQSPLSPIYRLRVFSACLMSLLLLVAPMAPLAASVNRIAAAHAEKKAARDLANNAKKNLTTQEALERSPFVNPPPPVAPNLSATLTDSFVDTSPADGRADPGSTVTYTAVISNSGSDATGVSFSDTLDGNTTLVPGSLKVSPLAFNDLYSTANNTQLVVSAVFGVLQNDKGTPAPTVSGITNPVCADVIAPFVCTTTQGGTVTLNTDGSFTYNPLNGFTGADSFSYTASNTQPPNDTGVVTITVGPPNLPPSAKDDAAAATEAGGVNNGTAGSNPAGNLVTGVGAGSVADTDPEAGALTVVAVHFGPEGGPGAAGTVGSPFPGTYGSLTLNSNGSYTYTVDNTNTSVQALRTSGQTLQDVFNYTIQDPGGLQDIASFTITIAGANDNPVAVADTAAATEAGGTANGTPGSDGSGNVLTNDTDVDTLANGETKTVQGVAVGNQAGPLTTNVGVGLTGAGPANYGTLTIAADGTLTYVVNNANTTVQQLKPGDTQTDTFSYTMKDAANVTSTTTVTVTINGADDDPSAVADSATVNEDSGANAVDVLTNDTDVDTGPKNIASFTPPANGTVLGVGPGGAYTGLTYQPNPNYCNSIPATVDTFTYTLNGGSIGTVSMTVNCVNDPPVNTVPGPQPVDDNATLTFSNGNGNAISVNDIDVGGGNLQVTVSVPPAKGTLSGAGFTGNGTNSITITNTPATVNAALNGMVYTPPTGLTQDIVLTVLTSDLGNSGTGGAQSDSDTVTITVNAPPAAVNDPYSTPQNTPLTVPAATGVLNNDTVNTATIASYGTPVGNEQTTIGAATPTSAGGSVTLNADGSFSYTVPNAGFSGPDTFNYILTNARGSSTATVTITVAAPNSAPTANNDTAAATEAGGANNGTAGTNPAGNLVLGTGSAGAVADTDVEDPSSALTVVSVRLGSSEGAGAAGTVGGATVGTYGTLNLSSNGAYTYTVDNTNALVQALRTSGQTLQDSFNYTIQDTGSLTDIAVFTVTIAGANDAPTDTAITSSTVAENQPINTVVGDFSTTDVDAGDTFTYTLVAGAGSTDNGSFNINGAQLRTGASFDFETKSSYAIRIRSTDAGGLFFEEQYVITVTNVNEAPTNIALSSNTIGENMPVNTVIGNLSTTDPDAGDTFTYSLVVGVGDTDNASFNINGNQLRSCLTFDFETKSSYSIRVRSTDAGSLNFEKVFTITIVNNNDAPTDIALSNSSVAENSAINTVVGNFSTTDQDAGNTFTYTLVVGTGDNDNGSFNINGAQLRTSATFDFETKSSYTIRVRSTDNSAAFFEKQFTITVTDVPEAPVLVTSGGSASFTEDGPSVAVDTGITVADQDSATLASGTIQITGALQTAEDVLAFTNDGSTMGNIAVSVAYNPATGLLTLSSAGNTATLLQWQNALRAVTYNNTSQNPTTTARTVSFQVKDPGNLSSNLATKGVTVTAVNDAPVLANSGGGLAYTENGAAAAINTAITVTDVDSANIIGATVSITTNFQANKDVLSFANTVNIIGVYSGTTGVLTLTGTDTVANYQAALRNVKYSSTSEDPSTLARTVVFQVNDGGAVNNLSNTINSTVNVTATNDPPTAVGWAGLPAQAGIEITYPAGKLSGTDNAEEAANGTVVTIATIPDSVTNGTVTINANGDGGFKFTPNSNGLAASFTYHVNDNGKPGAGVSSTPVSVSFTVAGPPLYFVKSATVGLANCTLGNECLLATAITKMNTDGPGLTAIANAVAFIEDANTHAPGTVTLGASGQSIIGQGVVAASFDSFFGIGSPAQGTLAARPSVNQTRPTINGAATITAHNSTQLRGFNYTPTGNGLVAASRTNLVVGDMNITSTSNTGGQFAVNFTSSSGTFTFGPILVSGANVGGGVNFGGTTSASTVSFNDITTAGGPAFQSSASNGTTNFTFNDIKSTTGIGVTVTGGSGSFTFHAITVTGASKGASLTGSYAGAFSVTGTSTTAGTGGTISGTSGRGIEVVGPASPATQPSVNVKNMNFTNTAQTNGEANPTNCGATGPSGGNINCSAAIHLNNVNGATFDNINITGTNQNGINGLNVINLKILNSTVQNAGNESGESGVFIQNLSGLNTALTNSTFNNNRDWQFAFVNFTNGIALGNGGSPFNVSNCNFTGKGNAVTSEDGFLGRAGGNSTAVISIGGGANSPSHFTKNYSYGVFMDAIDSASLTATVNGNDFGAGGAANYNNSGIAIGVTGTATVNYTFTNNTIVGVAVGTPGNGVGIIATTGLTSSGASIIGTISGNTIGDAAIPGSGGFNNAAAMQLLANGGGNMIYKATVTGNHIHNPTALGIQYIGGTQTGAVTGTLHITGNDISTDDNAAGCSACSPAGVPAGQAIAVAAAASGSGGAVSTLCADIGGAGALKNTITGTWDGLNADAIRVTTLRGSIYTVGNMPGVGAQTVPNVTAFVSGQNGNAPTTGSNTASGGGTFNANNGSVCPLLLALGGVAAAEQMFPLLSGFNRGELTTVTNLASTTAISESLSQQQLDAVRAEAIARWAATGLTTTQVATLRSIKFEVSNLDRAYLGESNDNNVQIDRQAGGQGWYIRADAASDSLFSRALSSTRRYTDPLSAPAGHLDLLTAIEHEMGHKLGLDDRYAEKDRDNLMYGYLTVGERRLPAPGQAKFAIISNNQGTQHLKLRSTASRRAATPVRPAAKPITPLGGETVIANIGTLPAGKSVTITFKAVLNTAMPSGTSQVVTQGTVTYNSGPPPLVNADFANPGLGTDATLLTDDPATPAVGDATITPIDAPTASGSEVAGRILDSNGNPVEGAAVRMTGTQNRLTVTDAAGNYHFDDVETNGFYTVVPSRANFSFSPSQRAFSQLGQHTDAIFSATSTGGVLNPLDTTEYFVRQQYLDFLNREPDESGLGFWVNNIESCGNDANCRAVKRTDTSAAFFLSVEFQQTGYLVYRTYQAAFGDLPGASVPIRLGEFKPDAAEIGNGVIVNQSGWDTVLDNNKQAFAAEFVQRARFASAYPTSMTPADFVDKLFTNAGVRAADSDRAAAISEFGSATTSADVRARGRALRRVAENTTLAQQEFTQAFVLMEYFGYLRRDANTGPDTDFTGYNFWLDKLNAFGGNYQNADMVKAFLVSGEYRGRFPR